MTVLNHKDLENAILCLRRGELIAYPTEAVYGLGCDPGNQTAVERLIALKGRDQGQGLIVVAASWDQVAPWIAPIDPSLLATALATWPGPHTWVFPVHSTVPSWLTGRHGNLAVRISAHPIVQQLCAHFAGPVISTSANYHGQPPARDATEVRQIFGDQIAWVIDGPLGGLARPTSIRDVLTQAILRAS